MGGEIFFFLFFFFSRCCHIEVLQPRLDDVFRFRSRVLSSLPRASRYNDSSRGYLSSAGPAPVEIPRTHPKKGEVFGLPPNPRGLRHPSPTTHASCDSTLRLIPQYEPKERKRPNRSFVPVVDSHSSYVPGIPLAC